MTGSPRYRNGRLYRISRSVQAASDTSLDRAVPRKCTAFVIFRKGWDKCAKCRKTRKEHE